MRSRRISSSRTVIGAPDLRFCYSKYCERICQTFCASCRKVHRSRQKSDTLWQRRYQRPGSTQSRAKGAKHPHMGVSVNAVISGNFGHAGLLAGTGQSLSVSLKAAGGADASVQTSEQQGSTPPRCTGFSVSPGAGAEADAGSLGRTITVQITR